MLFSISKVFKVGLMSLCLAGSFAHAGFVDTDWQVNGDSRAVLHEETGIEWLKLNETNGMSINGVSSLLGSTYSGWRLPTRNEVNVLLTTITAVDSVTTGTFAMSSPAYYNVARSFANIMGINYVGGNSYYSLAFHVNDAPRAGDQQVLMSGLVYDQFNSTGILYDDYNYSNDLNFSKPFVAVFLVSDGGTTLSSINNPSLNANNPASPANVSVLSPAAALGLGLVALGFCARRKV